MALADLTRASVLSAIEEFDRLGQAAFLDKYGFSRARNYILRKDGRLYDSKAIVGAAHGYVAGLSPLLPSEFSGGETTVQKTLSRLRFDVIALSEEAPPVPGEVFANDGIVRRFAVGNMGGMRRSKRLNHLVLISDPFKGLYQDRWEGDVLHYTGMGPSGDQSETYAQNRTLTESKETGIRIHLLEALDPGQYTYVGEVELVGAPYQEAQIDDKGALRQVWMFPLKVKQDAVVPAMTVTQAQSIEHRQARIVRRLSTERLKMRARQASGRPSRRTTQTSVYVRDAAVTEYVKRLAGGHCDLCGMLAPFRDGKGNHYLECHHVTWLAQGGDDVIENTVALCPNCHRRMHVVRDKSDIEKLRLHAVDRAAK